MDATIRNRAKGALFSMFIGDALAMPVHWYVSVIFFNSLYCNLIPITVI
jgi:ADP-ribosylglycohydrolase